MRNLLVLSFLLSFSASAATVITYDDGSTYTLRGREEVYISTPNKEMFKRREYRNGDQHFIAQIPWPQRDYVSQPTDGLDVGSHEWCAAFIPWSEGLTFGQQAWDRYCDTNNNGVYDEGDDGWEG
jgi:hypothetical protein